MPTICPISDLRNKLAEISASVHEKGHPVLLIKNGVGNMVVMSIEQYEALTLDRRITDELDSPEAAGRITTALVNAAESLYRHPVHTPLRRTRHEYRGPRVGARHAGNRHTSRQRGRTAPDASGSRRMVPAVPLGAAGRLASSRDARAREHRNRAEGLTPQW